MSKEGFYEIMKRERASVKANSVQLSKLKYDLTISKVKYAKIRSKKEPADYHLLKRFDIIKVKGMEKLIVPRKEGSNIVYYVHDDELFDILSEVHISLGHVGRDKTMKEIRKKYKNITYKDIKLFLNLCEPCQQRQKRESKKVSTQPILFNIDSSELKSQCHVDLIDYQLSPDNDYKFVMVYHDYQTKFCFLKPLKSHSAEIVANNLMDIFTCFGAPTIIQSNYGKRYVSQIIHYLRIAWSELKIVTGKCQRRHERINEDIKNMISAWMQNNQTSKWSEGLKFVQLMRNNTFNLEIKRSPYEAFFGRSVKIGLCTFNIPLDVLKSVQHEEQLEQIIESIKVPAQSVVDEIDNENSLLGIQEDCYEDMDVFISSSETLNEKSIGDPSVKDDRVLSNMKQEIFSDSDLFEETDTVVDDDVTTEDVFIKKEMANINITLEKAKQDETSEVKPEINLEFNPSNCFETKELELMLDKVYENKYKNITESDSIMAAQSSRTQSENVKTNIVRRRQLKHIKCHQCSRVFRNYKRVRTGDKLNNFHNMRYKKRYRRVLEQVPNKP